MIYIIIPVFNRKDFTRNCLLSLQNQTLKEFKTIVVDDGSTDGTLKMLEKDFPEVTIVKTSGNLFWTGTINLGIVQALKENSTHILTLNNDTILSDSFIEMMVKWIKQKPKAILGGLAIDKNTKNIVYGGAIFSWIKGSITPLSYSTDNKNNVGLKKVDHFPGRGLLIPKIVFEKIGLFNSKIFPHYMADFDFTHQAFLNGFEIYCNYDAKIYTYPEESGDRKIRNKKNVRNYLNHLFDIKGGGNLRNFTLFALRNCPYYYLPSYLVFGYARRLIGYFIK